MPEKNTFFDINKLPSHKGLLLFALSMSKLVSQTPSKCIDDLNHLFEKIQKPLVGLNFIYSDFLYLYSDKPAPELKNALMNQVVNHKNGLQKIIEKESGKYQIQDAFNYMVWNQLYVVTKDFTRLLEELKDLYKNDEKFQQYIKEDSETFGKDLGDNQVNFFLEEILVMYLLSKNQIKIPNDFIEGQQKWILWCYPGRPLKSEIYIHQLNPFKLDWPENPYQSCQYDLEAKLLIDFNRVDLETYTVR